MLITYLFPYEIRLNLIKQKHSNSRTRALITAYLRQWVMVGVFLGRRAIALTCMQACHPVHQASHPVHQASHPAHQASSQNLHVLRINSHVLWSMTTLFCKQWHWQVHYFLLIQLVCVILIPIKHFFIHFCYTEAYKQIFIKISSNFQPKFNGLVLGLWPTRNIHLSKISPRPPLKISPRSWDIDLASCERALR